MAALGKKIDILLAVGPLLKGFTAKAVVSHPFINKKTRSRLIKYDGDTHHWDENSFRGTGTVP